MKKRVLSLMMALLLLWQLIPSVCLAAGGTADSSFVLAAATAGKVLIEPVAVSYTGSETLAQALKKSGYDLEGLDSGFVTKVQGVSGNYRRVDDAGGLSLDQPAKGVTFLAIVEIDLNAEQAAALGSLLKVMAAYRAFDTGVTRYPPAQEAYKAALEALYRADADASALQAALSGAMDRFDREVVNGKKVTAALTVQTLSGLDPASYTLDTEDSYGRTARFEKSQAIQLVPGAYSFQLQSGSDAQAVGTMTLTDSGVVQIGGETVTTLCLPDGEWLGEAVLHGGSVASGTYDHDGDTYYVADTDPSPYIYLPKGADAGDLSLNAGAVYTNTDGQAVEIPIAWASQAARLTGVLPVGTQAGRVTLKASLAYEGYVLSRLRTLCLERAPTLTALSVVANGAEQMVGTFLPNQLRYTFNVATPQVTITPATLEGDYTVTVQGKKVQPGESCTQSLAMGSNTIEIKVALENGKSRTYTLNIGRVAPKTVTVLHDTDLTLQLLDSNGQTLLPESDSNGQAVYQILPRGGYSYVTTKGCYTAKETFSVFEDMTVKAKRPREEDWLTGLQICAGSTKSSGIYLDSADFQTSRHEYTIQLPDTESVLYVWALSDKTNLIKVQETGTSVYTKTLTASGKAVRGLAAADGQEKTLTLSLSLTENGCTYVQNYTVQVQRSLSLQSLSLRIDGRDTAIHPLVDGKLQENKGFDRKLLSYQADLLSTAKTAQITATAYAPQAVIKVNGEIYDGGDLTLNTTLSAETVTITLCDAATDRVTQTYTIELAKRQPLRGQFIIKDQYGTPLPNAVAVVYDTKTSERILPDSQGVYPLVAGSTYRYTATCRGYVGCQDQVTVSENACTVQIALSKAPSTSYGMGVTSDWPNFRGDETNNGIISAKTPIQAENAMLSWATKLGESYGSGATGCPILITEGGWDYVISYAGSSIVKLDALSGKVVATGNMKTNSSFAINSPTYGGGMIFVGLAGGGIQAFDARTLKSLWYYKDALGGQPNSPITYHDGYLYTGFWNSEEQTANFVCLTATDEVPGGDDETKLPVWTCPVKGGFYWAGAYVQENFLLVGTDDGGGGYTTPSGGLLCLDPRTGVELDSMHDLVGDVRSTVAYDKVTDRYYFTSKGGYFYSVRVEEKDGGYQLADLKGIKLENGSGGTAMSTSTPVVYNGRAYIGVSGTGQFTQYSGHNITVIDLESWSIAYRVTTQGYPQTSGMLTTAYDDGYAYVYFFDNYTPGKLRVLKDAPGVTAPLLTTKETLKGNAYFTGKVLFTPDGSQAQYAICSPICDQYGNIYFKNDSAYLMSLSNTIERIELLQGPNKTAYQPGELFDPAGMIVRLHYSNGTSRVVPATRNKIAYLGGTGEALKEGQTETEVHFLYAMYQNETLNNSQTGAGKAYDSPTVSVSITVGDPTPPEPEVVLGDLNGDGEVNIMDVGILRRYVAGLTTISADRLAAADLNGDGKVNIMDVGILRRYVAGLTDKFPAQK